MVKALTDRFVAGVRTPGTIFDKKTLGLALRVGTRKKTWCFTYRNGGPTQWLKLGNYPAVGLAKARTLTLEHRHALDVDGVDPVVERRKPVVEPIPEAPAYTFADFVPVFVRFQKGRTKYWADEEGKIKRYLLPIWGPLPLKAITRTHVTEVLDLVQNKGLTTGTNRIQAVISRMFTVALNRGLVEAHPAARIIKRFSEEGRDRVLTDDELRALWAGLDAYPGAASDAVRLRLLLGQRGGETAEMVWSELDLDDAIWTLPRLRTKTKQRTHFVALPPLALALVARRLATASPDDARVFPDLTLTCAEHRALGVLHGGLYTWKDLRRTVGTRLPELGFDEAVVDRVLNHATKGTVTRKHYNKHAYVAEIRQALTAWDGELQRILANEPKKSTHVLPMRPRA